jgi:hypothetical protein
MLISLGTACKSVSARTACGILLVLMLAGCSDANEPEIEEEDSLWVAGQVSGTLSWLTQTEPRIGNATIDLEGTEGSGIAVFFPFAAAQRTYEVAYEVQFAAQEAQGPLVTFIYGPAAVRDSEQFLLSNAEPRLVFDETGASDSHDDAGILVAEGSDVPFAGLVFVLGASSSWNATVRMDSIEPLALRNATYIGAGHFHWSAGSLNGTRVGDLQTSLAYEIPSQGWTHIQFLDREAIEVQDYSVTFSDGAGYEATGIRLLPPVGAGASLQAPGHFGHWNNPAGQTEVRFASSSGPTGADVVLVHLELEAPPLPGEMPFTYLGG